MTTKWKRVREKNEEAEHIPLLFIFREKLKVVKI